MNLFLEAGADLQIQNYRGETALHRVIRNISSNSNCEKEDENIKFLVRAGAEVNAKDVYGRVPISLARDLSSVKTLLEMKADVNIRNKFGQTPIFTHLLDPDSNLEVIELLLQNNADVNILDNHQSSVLHYIAFECNGLEFVPLLNKFGVKVCTDKLDHLPCDISLYCGHKKGFDALCQCDKKHHQVDIFDLENKVINMNERQTDILSNVSNIKDPFSKYQMHLKSELLSLTDIGCVSLNKEGQMIRVFVNELISKICLEMSCRDKMLTNTVMESGSIRENTKVGIPNEFDFVCVLEKFGQICEVDEVKTNSDHKFAYLKLKEDLKHEEIIHLFDEKGYLDNYAIWEKCGMMIDISLLNYELFNIPNVYFDGQRIQKNESMLDPTFTFSIVWHGCYYKELEIDIDLVLACRIKGWWPHKTELHHLPNNIQNNIKDQGALLMFQSELMGKSFYVADSKFRISAMDAETQYMNCVSNLARDAYIISKIMCDSRICPSVHVDESQDQDCDSQQFNDIDIECMSKHWNIADSEDSCQSD
ncbi:uncharacterized protein LOC134687936 [Mytilus trossulus]|uniref:uncharacterized protein LOC134687936 n=1 Tax=Mytilus trossulus TaxID=6551 RepID=UPI00300576B0